MKNKYYKVKDGEARHIRLFKKLSGGLSGDLLGVKIGGIGGGSKMYYPGKSYLLNGGGVQDFIFSWIETGNPTMIEISKEEAALLFGEI